MTSDKSNTIKLKEGILPSSVIKKEYDSKSKESNKKEFNLVKRDNVILPEINYEKRKKEDLSRDKIIKIIKSDKSISSKKCPKNVTMEMLIDVIGSGMDMEHHVKNNNKDALWNVYYEYLIIHALSKS